MDETILLKRRIAELEKLLRELHRCRQISHVKARIKEILSRAEP